MVSFLTKKHNIEVTEKKFLWTEELPNSAGPNRKAPCIHKFVLTSLFFTYIIVIYR